MPRSQVHGPVTVAGTPLQRPRHICCFFDSREQEQQVVVPYIAEGIAQGEKVLTIGDGPAMASHLCSLADGGIDVAAAQRTGHLCSARSDDTYLAGGRFSKERMYDLLAQELRALAEGPYTRLRTRGDMSWALRNMPGTEELLDYESEVNALLEGHDAAFLCVYDANRVSGRAMLDILATHSHVVLGTVIHENPYYLTPAEYRRTIMARRAKTTALTLEGQPGGTAG